MILLANWVICRFHVSLGCNLNAFQSQSGNVSVSPPSGHGQVDGGNCRPSGPFSRKLSHSPMTFQILALHYKNKKSTEIYSYST